MVAHSDITFSGAEAYRAMLGLERYLDKCSIEKSLRELIKLRVSQINGCAFCIDMHWRDAQADGESEQRLYSLLAWRECPYYSERERAALTLAEKLTGIAAHAVPEEVHDRVREHFNDQQLGDLIWVIAAINAWNRVSIGSRRIPGDFQPASALNQYSPSISNSMVRNTQREKGQL